jgi:HSP20 family protein
MPGLTHRCKTQQTSISSSTHEQSISHYLDSVHSHSETVTATMSLVRRSNVFDPFSLDLWDPFDNMFRSSIVPTPSSTFGESAAFANARIDWKETPEAHVFKADIPGVKKEEVKVEVEDGGVLVISGQRAKEKEDKNDTWHRVERSSGQFVRRFRLPENAKVDQVKAGLENGVLTVTVPKAEVKKPEVKSVQITG